MKRNGRSIDRRVWCAAIMAALLAVAPLPAQAQLFGNSKLYVGTLTCNVSGSVGFLFGSTKELGCLLVRPNGTAESYSGTINRFGIDLGYTKAMHMAWQVYSLAERAPVGALAGAYAGSQASIAMDGSAGSTTLIGGADRAIILASASVQGGDTGVNFADGIAEISLAHPRR